MVRELVVYIVPGLRIPSPSSVLLFVEQRALHPDRLIVSSVASIDPEQTFPRSA